MENNSEWITGKIKISIGGAPLEMQMTVPAKPVKLRRMLPIFQQMSNSFTEIGVADVENAGKRVSCKKGCGACCRQPVPLAEVEAFAIAELVENLPEPRRGDIKKRFDEACRHFFGIKWFEKLDRCAIAGKEERQKVVEEYFHENIACPFLEDESCSIHEARPLACREYLVTSPAANCAEFTAEAIDLVPLPAKPSETLRKIGNSKKLNEVVNFLPLILALFWAEKYADEFPEKTGEGWMADFFQTLTNSPLPKGKNNMSNL